MGRMINDAFFVKCSHEYMTSCCLACVVVFVIWVTPDCYFTGVPREFREHVLRREAIPAEVLRQCN